MADEVMDTPRWSTARRQAGLALGVARAVALAAALPSATLVVFWPALGRFFIQDDWTYLVRAMQATPRQLASNFFHLGAQFGAGFYRPLLEVYFALLYHLHGLNPLSFQMTNLAVLWIDAALVAFVARRLGFSRQASIVAAFFFGCHAALLLPVVWTSAASSLLAISSTLATIWLVARASRTWEWGLALLTFAVTLTARDIAIVVPALVWLVRWWAIATNGGEPAGWRAGLKSFKEAVPFWALVAIYGSLRVAAMTYMATETIYHAGIGPHMVSNAMTLMRHASGLAGALPPGLLPLVTVAAGAFWAAVVPGTFARFRAGDSRPLLGMIWFAIGLAPMLVLSRHEMDPYYLDLALPGLSFTVGGLTAVVLGRLESTVRGQWALGGLLGAYLLLSAGVVRVQLPETYLLEQEARGVTAWRDVQTAYPSLPPGAILYLLDTNDPTYWALGFGDLFRVGYGDPGLRVLFSARGDTLPPPDICARHLFAFALEEGHLVDRTPATRNTCAPR